ncbi:hypothetical protein QBC33DRAFT_529962 [Phialemonium atrogriseum]|uniref:NAD(P)-binding domain-containing protein n=1 Tax=Phialemonium atrogriseum TaxID=1093897 RepID=A0AAJ0C4Y5_9PEZI|nr:uncharacterized protein QBC33DRAFT_529962 [Phialemonium atrogriseum]KAK1770026.1 hypothetical protein QBC33DRAFT_529962 [Phialemonium atrogriseum]
MKVIITGATGLVGGAVVRHCIANEKITHAFVLTRKPLPELATDPKVTVVTHDDFSTYPADLLERLAGAEGCIWAIGGRATQFPDVETAKRVGVDYTLAAANAFASALAPRLPDGRAFRFVFCSGKYAEWEQEKSLAFLADTRRIKVRSAIVNAGVCPVLDSDLRRN